MIETRTVSKYEIKRSKFWTAIWFLIWCILKKKYIKSTKPYTASAYDLIWSSCLSIFNQYLMANNYYLSKKQTIVCNIWKRFVLKIILTSRYELHMFHLFISNSFDITLHGFSFFCLAIKLKSRKYRWFLRTIIPDPMNFVVTENKIWVLQ